MATVKRFEELECWKEARELCKIIHSFISCEPFSKDYSLKNQINNSSGSAMDNIAEGFERGGNKEFIQFLAISKASAGETRSQLYRALDRNYISEADFNLASTKAESVSAKNQKLINYLNNSEFKGSKYYAHEPQFQYGNDVVDLSDFEQ